MKLTGKEQSFVDHYLVDLNATEAVIAAGYKVKGRAAAASHGYRLLRKPAIEAAIHAGRKAKTAKAEISQQMVLQGLMNIALGDARKLFDADGRLRKAPDLDDETAGAVVAIEVKTTVSEEGATEHTSKIKLGDKLRAFELIGRHLGMFEKKPEEPAKDPLDAMSATDLVAVLARLKGDGNVA